MARSTTAQVINANENVIRPVTRKPRVIVFVFSKRREKQPMDSKQYKMANPFVR